MDYRIVCCHKNLVKPWAVVNKWCIYVHLCVTVHPAQDISHPFWSYTDVLRGVGFFICLKFVFLEQLPWPAECVPAWQCECRGWSDAWCGGGTAEPPPGTHHWPGTRPAPPHLLWGTAWLNKVSWWCVLSDVEKYWMSCLHHYWKIHFICILVIIAKLFSSLSLLQVAQVYKSIL